jgi:tetratricopeptide (TPR) repeat protein
MRSIFLFLMLTFAGQGTGIADTLGDCRQFENKDRTISGCTAFLRRNPENGNVYYNRATAYASKGDYDRAIADFDRAIELDPANGSAYNSRGIAHRHRGEYDQAILDHTRAIELDRTDEKAFNNRGLAYSRKGDANRAIADYTKAIELNPRYAAPYNNRAWAYYKSGKAAQGLPDVERSIELRPDHAQDLDTRGHIFEAMGQRSKALADYNAALRVQPDLVSSLWARGQIYEVQGLPSLAIADYKRLIELKEDAERPEREHEKAHARITALENNEMASAPVIKPGGGTSQKPPQEIGRRVALVIGNAQYQTAGALTNPKTDASAVAAKLGLLGFAVISKYDLGAAEMRKALSEFEDKAAGADWALVYYAGHGMEMEGKNWLIPVDARLAKSNDVPDETIALDRVLDRVHGARKLRIVILDACRSNPFVSRIVMAGGKRALNRGLAPIEPEHGEVVFYAARDGSVAADGDSDHSPFATALLRHLDEEGVELGRFFRKVTSTVLSTTNPKQEPFVYGRLPDEDFYFKPPAPGTP